MTKQLKIKELVEQVYKLDIASKSRRADYIQARAIYYKLCMEFTRLNQTRIAKTLDKNHATIIHSLKQWDVFVRFIPDFESNYKFIRATLLEMKLFPEVKKRLTLDELLVKYNELLLENSQLRGTLETQKTCKCGKFIS